MAGTKHLCELQTALEKVVRLFVKLKGSFWSPRQKRYNFSSRLLSVKVIFPFPEQVAVTGARTYRTAWTRQPSTSVRAELMTSGPLEQHFCRLRNAALIAFAENGPYNGSGGFSPPAEMQNPSSLSRISVAPTQRYCHPISLNLWANNSKNAAPKDTFTRLLLWGGTGPGFLCLCCKMSLKFNHGWKM